MRFHTYKNLADIGDWAKLRRITKNGLWTDIMKIIGYIVNKYYKKRHGGPRSSRSYPKRLVHDLISKAVSMQADQEQSVLTASHSLRCDYHNQDSSLMLEVLLDWFANNFDYSDMKRLLFDTTIGQGYNAIDGCWKRCVFVMRAETPSNISAQRFQYKSKHTKIALKKTKMIADAVLKAESSIETSSLLNALLMSPCPNIAVHAALYLDEDDPSSNKNVSQCRKFDENGNLPLHLAAMNPVHHELFGTAAGGYRMLELLFAKPAIQTVLEVYPAAARTANGAGRIPLNLVLENYHKWSLDQAKRRKERPDDYATPRKFQLACRLDDAILELVKVAPEALQARDQKTHMYPFMLAASNKEVPLDLVYSMLRENPMAVYCGINQTSNKIYLKKKLDQSSLQVQELQPQVDQQQAQSNRLKRKRGNEDQGFFNGNVLHNGSNKRGRGMYR